MKLYFPNEETRNYVQMVLGYLLTGLTDETVFWIFYGKGSNGKSTLIDSFIEIFRPIADYIRYEELTKSKDKRNTHSTGIYDLRGKRAVFSTEIETDVEFDPALIKQLTGDRYTKARGVHRNYDIAFKNTTKLILQGNGKPIIKDSTQGWERRPVVIPFYRVFTKTEREKTKKSEIISSFVSEREGILNWLVIGYRKYRQLKTLEILPEQIQRETDDFLNENDLTQQFLDTYCIVEREERVMVKDFKWVFNEWLSEIGEKTVSTQWITKELKNKSIHKGGNGNTFYLGVSLLNQATQWSETTTEVGVSIDKIFSENYSMG